MDNTNPGQENININNPIAPQNPIASPATEPKPANLKTANNKNAIIILSFLALIFLIATTVFACLYFSIQKSAPEPNISISTHNEPSEASNDISAKQEDSSTNEASDHSLSTNDFLKPVAIDTSLALNSSSDLIYTTNAALQTVFGYQTVTNDGYTATVEICDFGLERYYNYSTGKGCESFDIQFTSKVVDLFMGGFGQAAGEETLFFLMEDGTVEYMPIYKAAKSENIKSYGKLNGISDVVRITSSSVTSTDKHSGWVTTIGVRSDGAFYDFQPALKDEDFGWN